ncbi:RNA cap guanine-N2 methyltransferase [Symmachiella macrocystis]|uniref:RNA cap guanine-N2 methyltransferase n=1 Tax=Symmachiella macrocystis TaxID=2527985 RepID=A0A5C6BRY5_9PLAN|nr:class I SAM-dependent methyltransferase [Symmachiella macrocystis]TWU14181.1 RNA cap guanine-N2 methyltransferase [Symmachiella macrocystis]
MSGRTAELADWQQWQLLHKLRSQPHILEAAAAQTGDAMRVQQQLRREFPADLVRAALTLVELRKKAAEKFAAAEQMWFDRQGMEQATSEIVAAHKAERFTGDVIDLCSGIGADAIALAARCNVVAVDRNPVACLRTQWNAEVAGVADRMQSLCGDVEQVPLAGQLVHIDPDRRAKGPARSIKLEDYRPDLEFLQGLPAHARGGAMKLSPASNFGGKFPHCEIELISLNGECKEATVWFGELAGPKSWRATMLPSGASLTGNDLEVFAEQSPLGGYLFDPDPAVVRAGLIDLAATELGLARLDDAEEYLTGEQPIQSPFVRGFEVLADLPNNDKEIRRYFRQADFGQVEIKCRHIPIQAEAIRKKLPLPGTQAGVLIFARITGKARGIVCRRLADRD